MIVLILAAGYATRLYPLTLDKPKPLLEIGGKPMLERILEKTAALKDVKSCLIVTNQKFFAGFKDWAANFSALPAFGGRSGPAFGGKFPVPIEVINDETTSNENRLGAIRDIEFVIKKKAVKDNLLIIGGDNLFEFSLKDFVGFAEGRKAGVSLALFDIKDIKKANIYGVAKIDSSNKVINFEEKPADPKSTLIATCVYYFPKGKLDLIAEYLSLNVGQDAPGNYIKWLSENDTVYGFVFKEEWYDIGDIASYKDADANYKNKKLGKGG